MPNETEQILNELTGLFARVPADAAPRLAGALTDCRRVFFAAAGRSGLMLKALAMRLAQMGRTVYVAGETVTPALEKDDLLVLASAGGSTPSVVRYAAVAKEVGARLFVISGTEVSPLAEIHPADILLPAPSKAADGESAQPMGSLFEQALLLLCDSAVLCFPAEGDGMKRRHANLE